MSAYSCDAPLESGRSVARPVGDDCRSIRLGPTVPSRLGTGRVRRWALVSSLLLVVSLAASLGTANTAGAAHVSTSAAQVVPPAGVLSTIAGTQQGFGSSSMGQQPVGLATSPKGLVIADEGGNLARLLAVGSATESVLAGDGVGGYNGDGSNDEGRSATTAELNEPTAVAVDNAGDTIIADTQSDRIRLVAAADCPSNCPFGLTGTTEGDIVTIAGDSTAGYAGVDGPAQDATLDTPSGLAVDPRGDLLVADTDNNVIRLVAATSCASACPFGLTSMNAGDIYTIAGKGPGDYGTSANAVEATATDLAFPIGIAVDQAGDAIVADAGSNTVSLIAAYSSTCSSSCPYGLAPTVAGDIYTIAGGGSDPLTCDGSTDPVGDGCTATSALLDGETGVALDSAGNILVADTLHDRVRMVAADNCSLNCPYGRTSTSAGYIYTVAGDGTTGYSGNPAAGQSAELDAPMGVAVDSAGNVLIADTGNNRVRMLAANCSPICGYGVGVTVANDI